MKNKCKDCGREFKFPWKLVRHRNRKTPCSPIVIPNDENGILCPKCNRNFSSCSSRNRHLKICPARNAENLTDLLLENQKKLVKNQKKLEKKMIKLTEACVEKDDKIKEMKNREANRIMHNVEHVEHVYLIHKREFIKCKESVSELDQIGTMIEGGQIIPALDRLATILDEHPDAAWALAVRGRLLLDLREYDSLSENADRFIRLQPSNPLALTQRAAARLFRNDVEGATASMLEALTESGRDVDSRLQQFS